jgi:AAHS family 4-hydroxybenzoate transporter-like MFS transporter
VGRIGSIVGPVKGGWLLSLQWEPQALFGLATVPAVMAAVAALGLHHIWRQVDFSDATPED